MGPAPEPTPTPDRFERLNQILNDALELPPAERESHIVRACGADESLRHSLQSLLNVVGSNAGPEEGTRTLANAPSLKTGDVLEGGYRILRMLGRGGMGEVYEAEDPEMDEHVAIKTIRPDIAADELSVARFRKEIQLGRKVSHPNVCNIYSIGKHGSLYFFTMELLRGETLSARLKKRGRMEPGEALPLLSQMADAIAAAHDSGIIHRDFKPANVMLLEGDTRRKAVVTDFGLARLVERSDTESRTGATHFAGTPAYMAPEQLEDAPLTKATDIYALGLVAYEMVTARRPFEGATDISAAIQRLTAKPAPPVDRVPQLDPKWNAAILRCLERQPADRWASACDFVEALSRTTATLPVPPPAAPAITPASRPVASKPRRRWAAAGLVVLAAVVAIAVWAWRRPPETPAAAQEWVDLGTAAVRDGVYWKATTTLDEALKIDADLPIAYARLAEAWNEMDAPDKAGRDLTRAYVDLSKVSREDRRYIEAINATVANQFAKAVQDYQIILAKLPASQEHFGRVDLGRAYEKNAEPKKALREYEAACTVRPNWPGAWLRLGVLEHNMSRNNDAKRDLLKALKLFKERGDTEGQVQAKFELARSSTPSEAEQILVNALATAGESIFQQVTIRLQRSYIAVKQGRLEDAKKMAEDAQYLADDNGLPVLGGRGLNDLGNALYKAGDRKEAEKYYIRAIAIAKNYHAERLQNAANMMLGQMLKDQDPERAKVYLETGREWFFAHGFATEVVSGDLGLERIYRNQGDYKRAQDMLKRVLSETEDTDVIANAHRDLSRIYTEVENYPAAIEEAERARTVDLAAGQLLADDDEDLSTPLILSGRFDEAGKALNQARADRRPEADLSLDRAQAALGAGNFKSALQFSKLTMAASGADPDDVIEANRVACRALTSTGRVEAARRFCEQALQSAKDQAHKAAARLAEIILAFQAKDLAEVTKISATLAPELERNGQSDSLWRCLAYQAAAALGAGNNQQAGEAAARSRSVFEAFVRSLGAATGHTFQNRADTKSDLAVLQTTEQRVRGRTK